MFASGRLLSFSSIANLVYVPICIGMESASKPSLKRVAFGLVLQEEEQLRGVVEHKHRMSQRIAELKRQLEESRTATADRTFQLQASEVIQVSR
jgi:hypothetical protein